jgi:hypothetical protein
MKDFRLSCLAMQIFFLGVVALEARSGPTVYDLRADWSEVSNPNGAWSIREGANALPHVNSWQSALGGWSVAQPAWARSENGNNRLPVWMKSNGSETFARDWIAGDVVVHSTDGSNGVGNGVANAAWISPCNGTASISGHVWMGRDIGRSNNWRLLHNALVLTGGMIASGDAFSRASPFLFENGSGGAAVLQSRAVTAGDVLVIEIERASAAGDFVGVNYVVTFAADAGCLGDADGSGLVDFGDVTSVLTNWGSGAGTCPIGSGPGDADNNGTVEFADITSVLTAWGTACR